MRLVHSLRSVTALFVALVLVPATILGWLGLRSTAQLEAHATEAAAREVGRVAASLPELVRAREAALRASWRQGLTDAAAVLERQLPWVRGGVALRTARQALGVTASWAATHGMLRWCDAEGVAILPRVWPTAVVAVDPVLDTVVQGERRPVEAVLAALEVAAAATAPPVQRARALAFTAAVQMRHGLDPAPARSCLLALPMRVVVAAGAIAVEQLAEHGPAGALWLQAAAEDGWLDEIPAPAAVRARWQARASLGAASPASVPSWSAGDTLRIDQVEVRAGTTLELLVPKAALLDYAFGVEQREGCQVRYLAAAVPSSQPVAAFGTTLHAVVENSWAATLETAAQRRRLWTGLGIAALLILMGSGLALVRRALARERAARALRDQFIANVSHELRTPLTSVRLHADMLAQDGLEPQQRRTYGRVVLAEGARLSALVDDLLDVASLERGVRQLEPEPLDLGRAAAAAVAAWQPLTQGAVLTAVVPQVAVEAMADPTALGRILHNLLHNAVKHGRPALDGGIPRIEVQVGARGTIEVRDNGPGLPPAAQPFERFWRGPAAVRQAGAGIGLALARDLARAMGGDLTLDRSTRETVFRVTLPLAARSFDG